ncbi:hypothetical protein EVAR_89189_1 [Eumeta japonica]|uniref:Uncharacterized protein n=1 Tax=Eumeta variegata TaxID=151549 RepID=A0A4C1YFV2_EUMVA|nr:hypothetical protein EVAR_89189_1 [Eumeta japonica]
MCKVTKRRVAKLFAVIEPSASNFPLGKFPFSLPRYGGIARDKPGEEFRNSFMEMQCSSIGPEPRAEPERDREWGRNRDTDLET